MQSLLDWLLTLPPGTLHAVLAFTAALENVIPPFPSDVVVAFGSFVAAQGRHTMLGVFLAVWLGNVAGAMIVYGLGRRYGAERLEKRLAGRRAESADARLRSMLKRFGQPAIFVSRFVPGVRAIVPAVAGALRLSSVLTATMIATASAIWYGLITVVAYRVGSDWQRLSETVQEYSRALAIGASVVLALGLAAWLLVRRSRGRT